MSLSLNRNVQQAVWQSNLPAIPSITQWGTRLTAHATPHNKGAYATLMTTTYDVYGFLIGVAGSASSGVQTDMMLDIALGASQERIIIPEFLCGWRAAPTLGAQFHYFPIFIPRGTVVSGRIQALITVDTLDVLMIANGGASAFPGPLFSGCDAYGTVIAASQGTSHTPGNSGSESTAANIGSATSKHYGAVMFSQNGTLAILTMNSLAYHWELVMGGVAVCEWVTMTTTTETVYAPTPAAPFFVSIPSGTQLQVRGECSGTGQEQDVALYCFY